MSYGLDSRTGQPCPRCGAEIVYNGNYFCERYTYEDQPGCDWAMGESAEDEKLFELCYPKLMANRAKDAEQRATAAKRVKRC